MTSRPAETAGVAGTIGLLVAYIFGVHNSQTVAVVGAAIGLVPAVVTALVANGGVRGIVRKVWSGSVKGGS